jgi:RNA polymerase sigma-70 factor (ECF subfamily)
MSQTNTPISLLDRLLADDDSEAWPEFRGLYEPLIQRWAGRFLSEPADIDDVVQEVMTTLLSALPKFEHNHRPGAFRSWLKKIMIRRIQRRFRRQRFNEQQISDANDLEDPNSRMSKLWDKEHDDFVLRGLLEKTRPEFGSRSWDIFMRVAIDGASPRVVAREFETSTNVVHVTKARVLKRLREEGRGLIE